MTLITDGYLMDTYIAENYLMIDYIPEYSLTLGGDSAHYYYYRKKPLNNNLDKLRKIKRLLDAFK